MRLALALVLAIIATVHNAGASAQDLFAIGTLQPDGSLQGTLVSTVGNLTWHAARKNGAPGRSEFGTPAPLMAAELDDLFASLED